MHRHRLFAWNRNPGVALSRLELLICQEFPGITEHELTSAASEHRPWQPI